MVFVGAKHLSPAISMGRMFIGSADFDSVDLQFNSPLQFSQKVTKVTPKAINN